MTEKHNTKEVPEMPSSKKALGQALDVSETQLDIFLKGFSAGVLVGSAIIKVYQDCLGLIPEEELTKDDFPVRLRAILMENRDKRYCGLEQPVSEETIDAIAKLLFLQNGEAFLNNIIF